MIEDTLIGKMVQPNLQQTVGVIPTDRVSRKNTGNLQPDSERNNGRNTNPAGTYQRSNNKKVKSHKQGNFGKRDQSFSKNSKKTYQLHAGKDATGDPHGSNQDPNLIQNLINFQYAPITRPYFSTAENFHSLRRKRTSTFNKEVFLQANCHFVVDETDEYMVNAVDPDVLVEWEQIQLVYLPSHDIATCPICLYPPTAAKMTRCGHVFCWSCMLHYLTLDKKSWRKCPICHEAVLEKDLKSVIATCRKKFARLDTITLKLMRRSKDSLFALPLNEWDEEKNNAFPQWKDETFNSGFKLALASPGAVLNNILLREEVELKAQLSESIVDESGEECFVQSALEKLRDKIEKLRKEVDVVIPSSTDGDKCVSDDDSSSYMYGNDRSLALMLENSKIGDEQSDTAAFTDDEGSHVDTESSLSPTATQSNQIATIDTTAMNLQTNIRRLKGNFSESSSGSDDMETTTRSMLDLISTKDPGSHYFYQADDGQNIFVHSVNARCLIEEYGSLANSPEKITGQIIDFECFSMTAALRKRYRYLSHLPLACEFVICELMLRPPFLSKHTIHNFMHEFKKRKDGRLKKLEEQRKFDRRANALRNKQEGYQSLSYEDDYEHVHLDLTNNADFPQNFSPDLCEPGEDFYDGPSFAQILKKTENAFPPPQEATRNAAWGLSNTIARDTSLYSHMTVLTRHANQSTDSDDGENIVAPSFKEMFSAAMLTTPLEHENEEKGNKKSKKKKKKGVLLFATGGQRKY